jgi:hypothetical protein
MRPTYQLAALGKYFGFPNCCIEEFLSTQSHATWTKYPDGPWVGTGFMPCVSCADKALDFDKFVADNITPHRACPTPFPDQGTDEQMEALIRRVKTERISSFLFSPVRLIRNFVAAP